MYISKTNALIHYSVIAEMSLVSSSEARQSSLANLYIELIPNSHTAETIRG